MEEVKYPVKYVTVWVYGLIILKAYLVSERIVYLENGDKSHMYYVVFPYKNEVERIRKREIYYYDRQYPIYDSSNKFFYSNAEYVNNIFDSYEETSKLVNEVNKKEHIIEKEIEKLKQIEEKLLELTKDMKTKTEKERTLILDKKNGGIKL